MQKDTKSRRTRKQYDGDRGYPTEWTENRLAKFKGRKTRNDRDDWRSQRYLLQNMDINDLREYVEEMES